MKELDTAELEKSINTALLSSLPDGIAILDEKLRVIRINPVVTTISGYTPNDLTGKQISDVIKIKSDRVQLPASLSEVKRQIRNSDGVFLRTSNWIRKDGEEITVHSTLTSYSDGTAFKGVVLRIRDISEQVVLDNAKTEFVSLAAHQLRTPLSSVNWFLELLSKENTGKLNQLQTEYLDELKIANKRMVALVNDLLNVSRIDLGTFAIKPEPTDLEDVINTVLNELSNSISEKNLRITTAFTGKIDSFQIDPQLAMIVFQNLISNAVKYTPSGGAIDVYTILDSEHLLITIDDTGYGIPSSQKDKIFNKLFRADNVTRRDTEGTGLGLYLVKAIVERSGGTISFSSRLNLGTTFTVTFPSSGMKRHSGKLQLMPMTKSHS